jgi:peptidoglycan/xylan/chitin deacetylase (PgdA/CDA1 family)
MRYLLRFDDLCPTMDWKRWDRVEPLLEESGAQPILAIVPANEDPELRRAPENPDFWDRARAWQAKGWIIAQHGYRHIYDSADTGLVPWWYRSEFAGHPRNEQLRRLRLGKRKMDEEGLRPTVWCAPSHTFDAVTLDVLADEGIRIISDGVNFRPYVDSRELVWVPVQPWSPPGLQASVRTVCIHTNTLEDFAPLFRLLSAKRGQLIGRQHPFDQIVNGARKKTLADGVFEAAYWPVFRTRERLAQRAKQILRIREYAPSSS